MRTGRGARAKPEPEPEPEPEPLTYLYCITGRGARPARVPPGLEGMGRPRLLDVAADLRLVAAAAPADRYGGEAIDRRLADLDWVSACGLAHAAVIEAFQAVRAVIPMKLFTLFRDDQRAIDHVRERSKDFRPILERIHGCEEWSVRLRLAPKEPAASGARAGATPAASGTRFLLIKKQKQDAARERARQARDRSLALHDDLAALARDAHALPLPPGSAGSPLLLDSVFLVPVAKRERFEGRVRELARELAQDGLAVSWHGPWAPYNFVG